MRRAGCGLDGDGGRHGRARMCAPVARSICWPCTPRSSKFQQLVASGADVQVLQRLVLVLASGSSRSGGEAVHGFIANALAAASQAQSAVSGLGTACRSVGLHGEAREARACAHGHSGSRPIAAPLQASGTMALSSTAAEGACLQLSALREPRRRMLAPLHAQDQLRYALLMLTEVRAEASALDSARAGTAAKAMCAHVPAVVGLVQHVVASGAGAGVRAAQALQGTARACASCRAMHIVPHATPVMPQHRASARRVLRPHAHCTRHAHLRLHLRVCGIIIIMCHQQQHHHHHHHHHHAPARRRPPLHSGRPQVPARVGRHA